MSDLTEALERLAPTVDGDRAEAVFAAARARQRRRRRVGQGAGAGVVAVLAMVALVGALLVRDDGRTVEVAAPTTTAVATATTSRPGPPTGDLPDRIVLADADVQQLVAVPTRGGSVTSAGRLQPLWASTDGEYAELLRVLTVGATGDAPAATPDLATEVVVAFNGVSGGCIPRVAGFDAAPGRTLVPRLTPPAGETVCTQPEIWTTYVVALPRADVAPWFELSIPGDPSRIGDTGTSLRITLEDPSAVGPAEQAAAIRDQGLEPVGHRTLADGPGGPLTTAFATDRASIARLWSEVGATGGAPIVDPATSIAVAFSTVDGGCRTTLAGFGLDADRVLHAVFVPGEGAATTTACSTDLVTRRMVVALDRATLTKPFTLLRVAADLGAEPAPLQVELPPAGAGGALACPAGWFVAASAAGVGVAPAGGLTGTWADAADPLPAAPPTDELATLLMAEPLPPGAPIDRIATIALSARSATVVALSGDRVIVSANLLARDGAWTFEAMQRCTPGQSPAAGGS